MKFAVIGGDRRSVLLCTMLLQDGHRVATFALEKAELPPEAPKAGCLQGCVYGADCVVLPTPAEKGAVLNAPFSQETLRLPELIGELWQGQILCGGKLSEESVLAAVKGKLYAEDILRRPDFVTGNAALTAEGAVALLMTESDRALPDCRALVTGWGRVGKLLALRLKALGAEVTVAARRAGPRAEARALGCRSLSYGELEEELGDFDFIVNTVPARVLNEEMLCCVSPEALLLELASPPGGFDRTLAANIGLRVLTAPGLPGTYAPYSAALLMKNALYAIIREQEE